ncbi:MAG: DUF4352 domain-containing protein [Bacteroidales bacterium]|nr:DUF4352 domain-containing protein [Lachnoclostridium sp.]MCM1383766.1 DUF4352 domain-containing protein [Lachnoclostridium sp.]MCM1464394.1 DUF4352 domain-containing protein [Bacteroidales bacterium]
MKKRIIALLVVMTMAVASLGCGKKNTETKGNDTENYEPQVRYPDAEGYAEGYYEDTMHTYFFEYIVNSAYVCKEYEGYKPQDGNQLLVADVTVKNTGYASLIMYATDFQVQWSDTSANAYEWPITYYMEEETDEKSNMFPKEYELEINESRTGSLVYEVPKDEKDFSISYKEYFEDGSEGDTFFVYFTAKSK